MEAIDGNFYGTTYQGGNLNCDPPYGCGTVFKISPMGALRTLHKFAGYPGDGGASEAGLIQTANGNLYGTTAGGGGMDHGTVFRITPCGSLAVLYSFCPTDSCATGFYPESAVVQAIDRKFYGTTNGGGSSNFGTAFTMTSNGVLTTLHSFEGSDGALPYGVLIQATDGNLYGTTSGFGTKSYGTIFTITPAGDLNTLYSFCSGQPCSDGGNPIGGVIQGTNGNFYGTSTGYQVGGYGTVYSLSIGLGPFVSFIRSSGKIGDKVGILGQGFTGTTSVSFNGTPARFTVRKDTFLTATVPAGATTGFVTVTAPSGVLKSNVPFHVIP